MPEVEIPEDWTEHVLGHVRFRLPPDLLLRKSGPTAGGVLTDQTSDATYFNFYGEKTAVSIVLSSHDNSDFLNIVSQMHPTKKTFSSMSELRLEACGAVGEDFRWSMSHKEATWHTFIISLRPIFVDSFTERTESACGRNWEGLLLFMRDTPEIRSTRFYCECNSCPVEVAIYFAPLKNEDKFDPEVARKIIRSLEINCCCASSLLLNEIQ